MTKLLANQSIEGKVYGEHGTAINELDIRIGTDFVYVGTYVGELDDGSPDPGNDPNTTEDSPPFENGWINEGGVWVPMRFRWQRDGYVELEGCATGGALGSAIFTFQDEIYIPDFDTPHVVTNAFFTFACLVVHADGTVTREA